MNFTTQISKCNIDIVEDVNLLDYEEIHPEQLLVQGYKMKTFKICPDDNSINIIKNLFTNTIVSKDDIKKITSIKKININSYNKLYDKELKKSKDFLNSKFKLHNIYINKNGIRLSNPFNIKISRIKGETFNGHLESTFTEVNYDDYEILFNKISLPLLISKMLPSIYSHEIVHTQIMSNFGSVNNFFNNEVLPIFIEILYQYENNFLSTFRINHLHISSSFIDKDCQFNISTFNDMLYYVSIVTAYKLFNIYSNGNIFIKNEILNNIQSVFDNKFTLEDLLGKYDLDWTKKRVMH